MKINLIEKMEFVLEPEKHGQGHREDVQAMAETMALGPASRVILYGAETQIPPLHAL